ncbi:hypothetical protein DFJ73DRAFT_766700 [Zopfochytrium polystomum]|nr:hypothetical protein DFJ73DRAFT_766700 [Zopfochytrium polystomum]
MSATTDIKVLQSLITSISDKLPINSSLPISFLESDVPFNLNVKAVIELCPWRLWDVIGDLAAVLDDISNPQKLSQNQKVKSDSGTLSNELLHSQLLVLRIISNCLAYYWRLFRESRDPEAHEQMQASQIPSYLNGQSFPLTYNGVNTQSASSSRLMRSNSDTDSSTLASASPSVANRSVSSIGDDPYSQQQQTPGMTRNASSAQTNGTSTAPSTNGGIAGVRTLSDPPPLDESLARYLMNALVPFFFTHTGQINPDNISHTNYTLSLMAGGNTPMVSSYPSAGSGERDAQQIANFFMQPRNELYFPNKEMFAPPPGGEILAEMQRIAGRIIFYISGSNWPLLFARIKQRLQYLMSTSGLNDSDEIGTADVTELRYLEWCNPNRMRLATVIAGNSFSRRVQYLAAIVLRKAIWNWIETHPTEFVGICSSQKRLEGNPEGLFLIFNSLGEGMTQVARRRAVFWPVQTMLLVLCPDILSLVWMGNTPGKNTVVGPMPNGMVSKAQSWLDNLRKAMKAKLGEVASLCLVDICRSSTFVGKPEGGALRAMTPSLEAELKDKLFSQMLRPLQQPSAGSDEGSLIDPHIMTDCLTTLLKLNPWNTLRTLMMSFFDGNTPMAHSVILVRSCLEIVNEMYPLPWNSGLDPSLAAPLRSLFMEHVSRDRAQLEARARKAGAVPSDRKARKPINPTDFMSERKDIVVGILKIWCKCPVLAIAKETMIIGMEDLRILFQGILNCLQDASPAVRLSAAECIAVLLKHDFVSSWDGTTPDWRHPQARPTESSMFVFWRTTSLIVTTLCRQLLDQSSSGFAEAGYGYLVVLIKNILNVLEKVLSLRIEFLKKWQDLATIGSGIAERTSAVTLLEKTLLILLCSPDADVTTSVVTCIGLLAEEFDIADGSSLSGPQMEIQAAGVNTEGNAGGSAGASNNQLLRRTRSEMWTDGSSSPLSIAPNIHVYRELKVVLTGSNRIAGQKAMQKKIRKILRKTTHPSPGNIAAWEEVYRRWRILCSSMLSPNKGSGGMGGMGGSSNMDIFEDKGDRQNFTGFLCAMGAMSLHLPLASDGPTRNATIGRGGRDIGGSGSGSHDGQPPKRSEVADLFISELVTLMTCDNVAIREYVKEFLGNELSTALLDLLIIYCENIVTNFLNPEAANHERITFFVESFISVLKMILERSDDDVVTEQEFLSMSGSVDFGTLILTFVHYLGRLDTNLALLPVILKIRIKICQLLEVMVAKKEVVSIRQDIRFRNRMVDVLLEWNSENIPTPKNSMGEDLLAMNEKLIGDLDLAIMKALVLLLRNLPLQPTTEVRSQANSGEDVDLNDTTNEQKGKLFYKNLSFFLKVLQRVKMLETAETKKLDMLNISDATIVASRARENIQNLLQPLKENTILSLSNLLAANIEVGLKYSLSMGYHEDAKIRTSFMEVLTNLLESGAKEQFEGLGEEGQVLHRRYERLVDLVVNQDLTIALTLAEVSDGDDVASVLISIFAAKGHVKRLLTAVIEHEVARTDYTQNLFRRNSMATRLLASFSRLCGHDYLVAALKPVLDEVLSIKPTLTFEIDPVRLTEFDDPSINLKNLKMLVKRLLDNIVGAQHHLPQELRDVCHQLSLIVGRRYPDAQVNSVGAFMFLRFICPAIVNPESLGTFAPIESKDIRRGLVLATKVIQNLANNVLFGSKESFMVDLNDLLKRNIGRVHGFMRYVSNYDPNSMEKTAKPSPLPKEISEYDLMRLHRALALNQEKIESSNLGSRPNEKTKALFTSLSTLIAQLGPAPDMNRLRMALISKERTRARSGSLPMAAQLYQDFMGRVANRAGIDKALEVMKERMLCYEHGVTKDGHSVVYFICRRVQTEAIDMELLIFHILNVLSQAANRVFDLLVDVTYFTSDNEWDLQWIKRLEELNPGSITQNLSRVFVLNCNTPFRKFVMNSSRLIDLDFQWPTLFLSNIDELYNYIPAQQLKLPKLSFLDKDVISVYSPVSKITNAREHIPVIVKVSTDAIHVISVQKQPLANFEAVITDTYRFADLQDVLPVTEKSELIIKYVEKVSTAYGIMSAAGNIVSSMVFSSPKRDAMIRDIRSGKAQYKRAKPTNFVTDERNLRPGDVPGTLLNMAMLNLGSQDPILRQTSYNLMVALASNFDFHVGNQLLSAKGLCIPGNNQGFIISISQHLAASEKKLTLEFLIECVRGFSKSTKEQKLFCLEYMTPWLPNLVEFTRTNAPPIDHVFLVPSPEEESGLDTVQQKLKSLAALLVDMTIQEIELFHLIQSKIWTIIGSIDELLRTVLELLVQNAIENGVGSQHVEVAGNTLITLALVNMELVSGKLLFRLIRCLESDTVNVVEQPIWQEISVLIRLLLMISFNNLMDVRRYLPEICHMVVLTAGLGRPLIRSSVHAICVNTIHSLCTLSTLDEGTLATLKDILDRFSSNEMIKLFGISMSRLSTNRGTRGPSFTHSALVISNDSLSGEVSSSINPTNLRAIVSEFAKIMSTGAGDPSLAADWKSRWMSLTFEKAFEISDLAQRRAFVALGVLARSDPSPNAFIETLDCLHTLLRILDDSNNVKATVVSATLCLIDMIEGLDFIVEMVEILKSVFWLGLGMILIGDAEIFCAAVNLIECTIKILDKFDAFRELGFGETLLQARVNTEMDKVSSIWFSADFSFAFVGLVLKGLNRSTVMRPATQSLLRTALAAARRNPPSDFVPMNNTPDHCLGYVVALLPSHANNVKGLFKRAGLAEYQFDVEFEENGWYRLILELLTSAADPSRSLLVVTVLVALLEMTDVDSEISLIYGLLGEMTLEAPEVVTHVYETLLPRMNAVLTTSQSPGLIKQVHLIYQTMMACAPQSAPTAPTFLSAGANRRSSLGSINSGGSGTSAPVGVTGGMQLGHRRSQVTPTGGAGGGPGGLSNGAGSGGGGGGVSSFPLYANLLLVARLSEMGLAGIAWCYMFGNPLVSAAANHFGEHVLCSLESRNVVVDLLADAVRRLLRSPVVAKLEAGECEFRTSIPVSKIEEEINAFI